jgi:hypothetical protein
MTTITPDAQMSAQLRAEIVGLSASAAPRSK